MFQPMVDDFVRLIIELERGPTMPFLPALRFDFVPWRGGFFSPSLEGGLSLFLLLRFSRTSRLATLASKARSNSTTFSGSRWHSSSNSSRLVIPEL
jgi:hypothetical protein